MQSLTVDFNSIIDLTDEQFYQLCQINQNLRFERNSTGEIIIMPPVGGESSNRNAGLTAQLWIWNQKYNLGVVFDASCVKLDRWNELTPEQKTKFLPIAPDFVIELLSPSDSLKKTQEKMEEYINNGVRLGWLINRKNRQVEIYRVGKEVEILDNPESLNGEDILPDFILDLEMIW